MSLNKMFDDFNHRYRMQPEKLDVGSLSKSYELIMDEMQELSEEIEKGIPVPADAVKECTDILYITMQRMRNMGIDVDGCLQAVHSSNMSKGVNPHVAERELVIAQRRYPEAYIDSGIGYCVLRDRRTNKVIKPTTYYPAVITEDLYVDAR